MRARGISIKHALRATSKRWEITYMKGCGFIKTHNTNRIREAREVIGLTRKELSSHYNIPLSTIQDWEGDRRKPPEYVLNILLRCMAVDFDKPILIEEGNEPYTLVSKTGDGYSLYHLDGSPLTRLELQFVNQERREKRVEMYHRDGRTAIYRCKANGFVFKVSLKV